MTSQEKMRQTNAFAMQNGMLLGLWSILAIACSVGSLWYPVLSLPGQVAVMLSPVLAWMLTKRFRERVTSPFEPFTFGRGYLHTLLMGLYACVWIAIAVYIYFGFFDDGALATAYVNYLSSPEVAPQVKELESDPAFMQAITATGASSLTEFFDNLHGVPPASYSGMIISTTLFTAPIISLFIALLTMRGARRKMQG
ncbi:MAG: DUF4199 domain-containing protein [Alloprevotella sp.]|nr:DUF4199 domain-containing protein [Alloprevotella sp.]MBR1446569.1 DUF4199 domain-containing protein [Alloprevotella sp.]MBR6338670.1 DUF4199 domain-containing protein [Alloprevotella sp.]